MRRLFLLLVLTAGILFPINQSAMAVPLTSCGAPGEANKLDPVANPYDLEKSGRRISSESISTWNAVSNGISGISANWKQWAANSQSVVTYFTYLSADAGASWTCYRSFGSTFSVGNLVVNGLYKFALIANSGDDWSKPVFIDIQLGKKMPEQICPLAHYTLGSAFMDVWPSAYSSTEKIYRLSIYSDPLKKIIRDESKVPVGIQIYEINSESLRYLVEYSIDNWKTKVVYDSGSKLIGKFVSLNSPFEIHALSKTKATKVRAIPDASHFFVPDDTDPQEYSTNPIPGYIPKPPTKGAGFTTVGCKPLLATFYPKEIEATPCMLNKMKCPVEIVPGENATKTSEKPVTISCVKGSTIKKVSGIDPKCPNGFKKK